MRAAIDVRHAIADALDYPVSMPEFVPSSKFNCGWLILALSATGPLTVAVADDDETEPAVALDPIVVVTSRSPRPISEVVGQVDVIDAEDIREDLVEDIDGLVRRIPGLEVDSDGTRFGTTGVNLRGIGGNRVAIEIDRVPVRDQFAIGAYSNAGRALVETDRIKRVEVLYGPASALYGSDALGGIMAVTTWDPDDLLATSDQPVAARGRVGYRGADDSWVGSAIAAVGSEQNALMAAGTWREGHELDDNAPSDVASDRQSWRSRDAMARWTHDTAGGSRWRLTAEHFERDVATDVVSRLGYGRRFRDTTSLLGDDEDSSHRLAAEFESETAAGLRWTARAFHSTTETDQRTDEVRGRAMPPVRIERRFQFEQDLTGLAAEAYRQYAWGMTDHRLGFGVQWLQTDTSERRDGLQTDLTSGDQTNVVLGETFPVRDFPDTETREWGVFVQDEIRFGDSGWQIIPALRWDGYDLEPQPDAIFTEDNPEIMPVSLDESRWTPRLGVLKSWGPGWSAYVQYSEGFRAPPYADVNIGFDIPLFGYRAIPNPDLVSETSEGVEIGIRQVSAGHRWSVAAFRTDYENFIESRALIGVDPATGDLLFQSRNIDSARIEGIDLRATVALGEWWSAAQDWSVEAAGWWARGDNEESGQPLNAIAPPQAVLALHWQPGAGPVRWGLITTATRGKDPDDIDSSDGERFASPGWTTLDLTVDWAFAPNWQLNAGLFNLTDRRYWRWLDVSRLPANDPMLERLSRPGRSVSVSLEARF